jgi:ribosome-binding protein aMBF1 (putative translation factor)
MITNERQYRITKGEIARFEEALSRADAQGKDLDPRLQQAMREGLESQLEELREDVTEYESLKAGKITSFVFTTLSSVAVGLIKARIAKGLTQKDLATALHLKEQQIQRYETTLYEGASLHRIQEVANVLGIREQIKLEL